MLVSEEDCTKFDSILSTVLEEAWNRSVSAILTKLTGIFLYFYMYNMHILMIYFFSLLDSFYVSIGATAKKNDIYPHGKPLGPLSKNDWTTIVERTMAQYGRIFNYGYIT